LEKKRLRIFQRKNFFKEKVFSKKKFFKEKISLKKGPKPICQRPNRNETSALPDHAAAHPISESLRQDNFPQGSADSEHTVAYPTPLFITNVIEKSLTISITSVTSRISPKRSDLHSIALSALIQSLPAH
jgi:hypothetical protein